MEPKIEQAPQVPTAELDALLDAVSAHLKATAKDYATDHRSALALAFEAYKAADAARHAQRTKDATR